MVHLRTHHWSPPSFFSVFVAALVVSLSPADVVVNGDWSIFRRAAIWFIVINFCGGLMMKSRNWTLLLVFFLRLVSCLLTKMDVLFRFLFQSE